MPTITLTYQPATVKNLDGVYVLVNGRPYGSPLNDNVRVKDNYRYHDLLHFAFATELGWSPCVRALLGCKRKHDPFIDETEDGARAIITEEMIALLVFKTYKAYDFSPSEQVKQQLVDQIMMLVSDFEVAVRSKHEWLNAIERGIGSLLQVSANPEKSVTYLVNERSSWLAAVC